MQPGAVQCRTVQCSTYIGPGTDLRRLGCTVRCRAALSQHYMCYARNGGSLAVHNYRPRSPHTTVGKLFFFLRPATGMASCLMMSQACTKPARKGCAYGGEKSHWPMDQAVRQHLSWHPFHSAAVHILCAPHQPGRQHDERYKSGSKFPGVPISY